MKIYVYIHEKSSCIRYFYKYDICIFSFYYFVNKDLHSVFNIRHHKFDNLIDLEKKYNLIFTEYKK